MAYTSRHTGQQISLDEHIQQSIEDLFTTPLGSRVHRRDYGFPIDLIDQPINRKTTLTLFVEAAKAINKWEPRVQVNRFSTVVENGRLNLIIQHSRGSLQTLVGQA